jgi:phospholipid transport system substrate-binding protein
VVTTDIVRPSKPTVKIQWRVRPVGSGFKIVDVVTEGVSMALTQQSEFAAVIRARGGEVEGLLEDMREKVAAKVP